MIADVDMYVCFLYKQDVSSVYVIIVADCDD